MTDEPVIGPNVSIYVWISLHHVEYPISAQRLVFYSVNNNKNKK